MSRNFMGRLNEASSRTKAEEVDISPQKVLSKGSSRKVDKDAKNSISGLSNNIEPGRQAVKVVTCVQDLHMKSSSPGESKLKEVERAADAKNAEDYMDGAKIIASNDERSESPTTHSTTEAELQRKFDAELAEYRSKENLVSQCSEYIFDLFDANCLDDYKTMEAFETMALDAFTDFDTTEITFEQEALHKEFLELFERLIGGFLKENNCSVEEFHLMCHSYLSSKEAEGKEHAQEVVDVIFAYTDLSLWASAMRDRAKLRHNYRQKQTTLRKIQLQKTAMEEAMDKHYQKAPAPAMAHRFDSK